jgi:hypothetical protein
MATLFFSYSHADENLRDQLEKHLSVLKRQGVIEAWHDRRIVAGQEFGDEIDTHLDSAEVILLLVSSDFLASDYCWKLEMTRAIERHERKEAVVIPVIIRPCDWHDTPFGKLLASPKDGRAVTLWPNLDEAFLDIVSAIKKALPGRAAAPTKPATTANTKVPLKLAEPAVRSSNLRIAKKFSDFDKDRFKHEGFEYLARFFERSIAELEARNEGINGSFRRIDGERFSASVYRDGKKVCQCSIFLDGMMRGIAYAMSDEPGVRSLNEILSVEADDQQLYFRSLGMQMHRSDAKLSFEGAAEFYWELFIKPIQ